MTQTSTAGFIRTEDQAELDVEALRLRSRGQTYRQVAAQMECDVSTAHARVQRALQAIPATAVAEYRTLELEKLDAWEQATLKILEAKHVFVSQGGKVVYDVDEDGVTSKIIDDEPTMKALHTLMKIQDQRAKLLGLYAPARSQVEITTYEGGGEVERELQRLAEQIESAEASAAIALPVGDATGQTESVTT